MTSIELVAVALAFTLGALGGCARAKPTADLGRRDADAASPAPKIEEPTSVPTVTARADAGNAPELALLTTPGGAAQALASGVSPVALKAAVHANNAFAVALFARLRGSGKAEDLLTSPLSATLALTMASAGAKGQTRSEMAKALQFGVNSAETIFAGQNALSQALLLRGPMSLAATPQRRSDQNVPLSVSDYQLQLVNSIWGQTDYPWQAPFLQTLAESYGTGLNPLNFRSQPEPARQTINDWVSAKTSNKIRDLIPKGALDDSTRLVLVNALHLRFPWANPFWPAETATGPFTHADGRTSSPRFMHVQHEFAYRDDGSAQIIALPLAGGLLSVLVALPHAGVSLDSYERSLRAGSPALIVPSSSALVSLSLPRTAFTSATFSLRDALRGMGMTRAFDRESADLSGMCKHIPDGMNLYVSDVLQKTMISMQETGVEAAAATAVLVLVTASARLPPLPPPVPIPMIVNRPYLISVVDVPTGAVLLLGQIEDPSDAGSH